MRTSAYWLLDCRQCANRAAERQRDRSNPRLKFNIQKHRAVERGIAWEMTFDEWWALWAPHWSNKGRRPDQMCMARRGDVGPYAAANVAIVSNSTNSRRLF